MLNVRKLKSSQLDSAIYAMILGDGSCDRGGGNFTLHSNFIYKMGHCNRQKEYLLWKKQIIEQISHTKCRIYDYSKTNSTYLVTNALKYFTKLQKIFYANNKKQVTKKILDKLTDLSLAIWFLDDGYMSKNKSGSVYGELCTDQFSYEEQLLIQDWIKTKFNIEVGIRKLEYKSGKYTGKIVYRIKFNKNACQKLSKLIKPYVEQIECMKYKLKC